MLHYRIAPLKVTFKGKGRYSNSCRKGIVLGSADQSPARTQMLALGAFEQLAPCALLRRSSSVDCSKWPLALWTVAAELPGGEAPGGEPALRLCKHAVLFSTITPFQKKICAPSERQNRSEEGSAHCLSSASAKRSCVCPRHRVSAGVGLCEKLLQFL